MSLSTKAISSGCFCHCCSDILKDGALEGWRRELRRRLIAHNDSGADFLSKYVPSKAPCPPPGDITSVLAKFEKWKPRKGQEVQSYPDLLVALDTLVSFIPKEERPFFMDGHEKEQYFPFATFSKNHHSTFPDIVVLFPGKTFSEGDSLDWFGFSSIIEVKAESNDDPFRKRGHKHCKTLVQLAVNARNLMHAHGLTCTFVLGIYGNVLRICRFDHSGAVICSPLNLKNLEDLKVARQFFWNFVHPLEDVPFVGWDPTVRQLTTLDQRWLRARLRLANIRVDTNKYPVAEARSLQVFDGESEGGDEPHTYIVFRILDINGRLFSRATTVWHGIRDTRRLVNGRLIDPVPSADDLRVRVIKEAWRQIVRRPEKDFYDRLDSTVAPHERKGLPTLVRGSDLGEREVRLWESALYGAPTPVTPDGAHHKTRLSAPASLPVSTPIPLSFSSSTSPSEEPCHRPMQQTFTWRQARGAKYWHRERSHVRFVVREVGRPVTQFRNTKELVMAFRDAIIGHRTAMSKGGILHRDISVGNILIVDDPALQEQFCGFIHDFDYSSMSREVPQDDLLSLSAAIVDKLLLADDFHGFLKERTGTFLFMASDLLDNEGQSIIHSIHHDLESFYWALLWVVIRHTDSGLDNGVKSQSRHATCALAFKQDDADVALMAKSNWLLRRAKILEVFHNSPLTDLMKKFASLVHNNDLNYDNVLALFDAALADGPWPQANDGPLEYIPPDLRTVNAFSSKSFEARSSDEHRRRHLRKRARAGKGKEREVVTEQDDNGDGEDDYDEPWESDDEDQPYAAAGTDDAEGDAGGNESIDIKFPVVPGDPEFDEEDLQDAADVSALLGYGDVDMEDIDMEDADANALSSTLQDLTLSHRPLETAQSANTTDFTKLDTLARALRSTCPLLSETAEAGPSSASGSRAKSRRSPSPPPAWRRHAALPTAAVVDGEPPVARRPNTRAHLAKQAENTTREQAARGGMSRSGPQTRSAARAGHSGGARSEGGSQTGSRGSRTGR